MEISFFVRVRLSSFILFRVFCVGYLAIVIMDGTPVPALKCKDASIRAIGHAALVSRLTVQALRDRAFFHEDGYRSVVKRVTNSRAVHGLCQFALRVAVHLVQIFRLAREGPDVILHQDRGSVVASFNVGEDCFLMCRFRYATTYAKLNLQPDMVRLTRVSHLQILSAFLRRDEGLLRHEENRVFRCRTFPPCYDMVIEDGVRDLDFICLQRVFELLLTSVMLRRRLKAV